MYPIPDEKGVCLYLLGRIPGPFVLWFTHKFRPGRCKEQGFTLTLFQFLLKVFVFLYPIHMKTTFICLSKMCCSLQPLLVRSCNSKYDQRSTKQGFAFSF